LSRTLWGCKDKKEFNKKIRKQEKRAQLFRVFLKLRPNFFHERGSINKTFNFGIVCCNDRMAIALPPFFTLMNE